MSVLADLPAAHEILLEEVRRAVLATIRPDGRPRLVPITFAADRESDRLFSPLDEKLKSVEDPRDLARVRDINARPRVTVLLDRWDEDWAELAWLRLDGRASLLEPNGVADAPEHAVGVALLRARYPQYDSHALEARPLLLIDILAATGWTAR
jgi:PPOX class probable F420-dependent enzyme